jgi:uncharacterized membrane protein YgcG
MLGLHPFTRRRSRRAVPAGLALAALTAGCLAVGSIATAQSVQVPPVSLPAVPSGPGMLLSNADVPTLQARRTDPAYAAWYTSFRGLVDANIGRVSSALGDDTLGRFAKAAAALEAIGERPASGGFSTYRDAAAAAIGAIANRTSNFLPGSGTLQAQYDAATLQCMAEAYDMLRGSGLSRTQDTTIRQKIFNWAGAITGDVPLGFNASNIMCKSGAALVSAAMALPGEAAASGWLQTGVDFINRPLAERLSPEGFWREGPHYANYTLNNLVSAAWHVRNRTGIDWFPTLKPFVRYALDAQLPSGLLSPYEEGIPVSFPHHTMLRAYAGDSIQAEMAWAWRRGTTRLGSYQNQQQHDVTAFVLYDAGAIPQSPSGAPATFRGADENLVVLRSGLGADALHASLLTAVDYSLLDFISSRHNLQNPLDLVLHARGQTLLPTSGGGPLITRSPNRAHYLDPSSNNTILVNRTAPFIANAGQVVMTHRVDEEADADTTETFLDAATTTVTGAYQNAQSVARTLAVVGGGDYLVVADEVTASSPVEIAVPWRGRGPRRIVSQTSTFVQTRWSFQGLTLEHAAASDGATLDRVTTSGWYADAWNQEEAIQGIEVRARAQSYRTLNVLEAHTVNDPARTVVDHGAGGIACVEVRGARSVDWIGLAPGSAGYTVGQLGAQAHMAFVRVEGTAVRSAAMVDGAEVRYGGRAVLRTTGQRTATVTSSTNRMRVTFAQDTPFGAIDVRLDGFADVDPQESYAAALNGVVLDASRVTREGDAIVVSAVTGGGELVVAPTSVLGSGSTGGGSGSGGGTSTGGSGGGGGGSSSGGCSLSASGGAGAAAPFALLLVVLLAAGAAVRRSC